MAYIDNVTSILQIQPDGLPTTVRLSQNENGRNLYFQLAGNEIDIPANATITISGTKPDGTVYSGTGSISDNVILIPEMIQMTAVAGYWDAKVKIISGGNTIATGRIRFVIDADTVDPDSVPSDSELEGLVAEAQQYAETARTEAYGSPLTATTAAGMTDHTRVYVYTGSETGYTAGHWYYWDGTQWADGGIYNSTAVNTDPTLTLEGVAADAAAVGSEISGLKEDLNLLEDKVDDAPEVKAPEETDADLYICDSQGNVIAEFKDGHIIMKNFNSEVVGDLSDLETTAKTTLVDAINEAAESGGQAEETVYGTTQLTDGDADFYITDQTGNGLMRLHDGQIETSGFSSDNGCYKKVFSYNGSGNQTITRFFPSGTTLAFHLYDQSNKKTGAVASYKVTYKYTDRSNVEHTLGQDYGYNFPTYTLPDDAIAVSVSYGNGIVSDTRNLTFAVYAEGSFPRKPKIIKVAQDGSGDFTTLRGAVDSISDNNEYNPYEIWIYPGTYNVLADYTDAEISASGFQGLFICDGVSLIGKGHRSEIVINGTLDTTAYDSSKRNDVSTLNIVGTCRLENLTVNASYIRYAVHDDTGSPPHKRNSRTLKNLKVYGEHMTSGGGGQISYGAGGSNSKTVYAKDCDFSDAMTIHTDVNASHSYHVYLENCTARRFIFGDYDSGIPTYYFMRNCKAQVILIGNTSSHAQYLMLDGEGTNDAMVLCPSGYVYNIGDCRKFYNQSVAACKAVKLSNNYGGIAIATSIDSIYGVSLGVKDSATYVQIRGWINASMLGLTGLNVGDYLTVDSSGNVVSGGTSSNAIAQVRFIDENSVAFARLMI